MTSIGPTPGGKKDCKLYVSKYKSSQDCFVVSQVCSEELESLRTEHDVVCQQLGDVTKDFTENVSLAQKPSPSFEPFSEAGPCLSVPRIRILRM